jgi:hypothetical protein
MPAMRRFVLGVANADERTTDGPGLSMHEHRVGWARAVTFACGLSCRSILRALVDVAGVSTFPLAPDVSAARSFSPFFIRVVDFSPPRPAALAPSRRRSGRSTAA